MIDRNRDLKRSLSDADEGRRDLYRKPQLRLRGTLEAKLLGSPPPPPSGMILGIPRFPWK